MSIYRKFIDSAKKSCEGERRLSASLSASPVKQRLSYQENAINSTNRQISLKFDADYCSADDYLDGPIVEANRENRKTSASTSVTNINNNKTMQFACSTVNSTPVSKQQYKRLVNSNENHYHPMPPFDRRQTCRASPVSAKSIESHQRRHLSEQQQQQQPIRSTGEHEAQLVATQSKCPCCPPVVERGPQLVAETQQENEHCPRAPRSLMLDSIFKTDDPVMLRWLSAMRFETELECLYALQARTLAIDEHSANALSIRNSQVTIQEIRSESNFIIDFIDYLIDCLPLNHNRLARFSVEFSEIWASLMKQTQAQTRFQSAQSKRQQQHHQVAGSNNNQTIINCTPRKLVASARTLRPLDKLADQIRNICLDIASSLHRYQENFSSDHPIDNGHFEASLRLIKELYGKFVEISIRVECTNIVRALDYDFSQSSLNRLGSSASLQPVRPFESSAAQLPLKWALIALWQLTKDDSYICRTLTEKWQTSEPTSPRKAGPGGPGGPSSSVARSPATNRVAKRLDYSTKYDDNKTPVTNGRAMANPGHSSASLQFEYDRLFQICQQDQEFRRKQEQLNANKQQAGQQHQGALSKALDMNQQRSIKQISTIEMLIDIIISQPNKHERLDMMNMIHSQAALNKLIDLDELDQNVSAAIFTSNQYKVAALRILNHLCVNEQAVKMILRCFNTPPASQDQERYHYLVPENKIIRSIFECYQTAQEHIYQNETMFHSAPPPPPPPPPAFSSACSSSSFGHTRGRKRSRGQVDLVDQQQSFGDDYSDYGSRQTATNSIPNSHSSRSADQHDQSDDAVVKEALRLLIQLTTFFHRSNQGLDFYNLIGRISVESLVKYLTNIIKSTGSRETLLLSLSTLANISFITTDPMRSYGTNRIILEMFRSSKSRSRDLELRDQAVTIMANTADKNLLDIVTNGGVTFLLSCLESCPTRMANYKQQAKAELDSDCARDGEQQYGRLSRLDNKPRDRKPVDLSEDFLDDLDCACDQQQLASALSTTSSSQQLPSLCLSKLNPNELAAMERIHQKTAVAFARISADSATTRLVLEYGGIKQMIDLCKISHKRNYSDTVLIACIAALRKMVKVIGTETFRHYNALDLIELELSHTLEIYGNPPSSNGYPLSKSVFASDV